MRMPPVVAEPGRDVSRETPRWLRGGRSAGILFHVKHGGFRGNRRNCRSAFAEPWWLFDARAKDDLMYPIELLESIYESCQRRSYAMLTT